MIELVVGLLAFQIIICVFVWHLMRELESTRDAVWRLLSKIERLENNNITPLDWDGIKRI